MLEYFPTNYVWNLLDAACSPDEAATQNEVHEVVSKLLAQLPNQWRRTVLLARVDDVPVSKIARLLNAPEGEVRSWLDHADIRRRTECPRHA